MCEISTWPILHLLEPELISKIRMVFVYGKLGDAAIIVTEDNEVYVLRECGKKVVDEFCNEDIKTFICSEDIVILALTQNGKVHYWKDISFENGLPESSSPSDTISIQSLQENFVVDMACGSHHYLALTLDRKVFMWGQSINSSNNAAKSQTGFGNPNSSSSTVYNASRSQNSRYTSPASAFNSSIPQSALWNPISSPSIVHEQSVSTEFTNSLSKVPTIVSSLSDKEVVGIACGKSFSIVVTKNGQLYTWGSNCSGQLGLGNYKDQSIPSKVANLDHVVIEKVVCGCAHVLALSADGGLYTWGSNNYGQLGLHLVVENLNKPLKLKEDSVMLVSDVAASWQSDISVAMDLNGRLFVWGNCSGQIIRTPQRVQLTSFYDAFLYYSNPKIMHRPYIVKSKETLSMLDNYTEAFDDPSTSDFTIEVQEKEIHVHKAVLKIRSKYFRKMFQNEWSKNDEKVVIQDKFSYNVYRAFLKFLYTDEIHVPSEDILEFFKMMKYYKLETQVTEHCKRTIKMSMTIENLATYYNVAVECNDQDLENSCIMFARLHSAAVIKTAAFKKLDKRPMLTFITKLAERGAFKT